jgi:hypothetical protein
VYRVDTSPAALRVLDGEAFVQFGGRQIRVGKGKMLALDGSWTVVKFDPGQTDALDRWSRGRSEYLAMASILSVRVEGGYASGCY